MNFSFKKINNNGSAVWQVCHQPPGEKRKRPSFKTKKLAEDFIAQQRKKFEETGTVWLAYTAAERAEMLGVIQEVKEAGLTLRRIWEGFRSGGRRSPDAVDRTLGEAYGDFYKEKEQQRLSPKSLEWYRGGVGRFVKGREGMLVRNVTREDCLGWLNNPSWGPRSFNAHRSGLHIFFDWCRKLKYPVQAPGWRSIRTSSRDISR